MCVLKEIGIIRIIGSRMGPERNWAGDLFDRNYYN